MEQRAKNNRRNQEKTVNSKKGKKLSPEHIEKISSSNKGRKNSDSSRNNMREAWKRRKAIIT